MPKVLVIQSDIVGACWESLCVTMQNVCLLNTTSIRQTEVLDAKVGVVVVSVRRNLTPMLRNDTQIREKLRSSPVSVSRLLIWVKRGALRSSQSKAKGQRPKSRRNASSLQSFERNYSLLLSRIERFSVLLAQSPFTSVSLLPIPDFIFFPTLNSGELQHQHVSSWPKMESMGRV